MKSHPLAWTSLAPALTGGRGVGGVALTSQEAAAWLSLLPFIPPKSPSPVTWGRRGDERQQRRGRWLKNFGLSVLPTLRFERPLKTRDSARDLGALARVLSAS